MGDWTRVIGALRRSLGTDVAGRASRVAEAAPGTDRYFTDEALQATFNRRGVVGVGPGSLYNHYAPWSLDESGRGPQFDNLRRLLQSPSFSGFNEVPWFELERTRQGLRVTQQEGRHRSAVIGQQPTVVGIYPEGRLTPEELSQLPVGVDRYALRGGAGAREMSSPAINTEWEDPLRYQLYRYGGSV